MSVLKRVSTTKIPSGRPVTRYDSGGAPSSLTAAWKFTQFAADAKRKSAAYDRIGFTVASDQVVSGDVALVEGDLIYDANDSNNVYLTGKFIPEYHDEFDDAVIVEWLFECIRINYIVNVYRPLMNISLTSGYKNYDATNMTLVSSVQCSIATASNFLSEPLVENLDHYFIRFPSVMDYFKSGDLVFISAAQSGTILLEHTWYRIVLVEPDTLGFTTYRMIEAKDV